MNKPFEFNWIANTLCCWKKKWHRINLLTHFSVMRLQAFCLENFPFYSHRPSRFSPIPGCPCSEHNEGICVYWLWTKFTAWLSGIIFFICVYILIVQYKVAWRSGWQRVMTSLYLFVSHMIFVLIYRGDSFRPQYKQVGKLRSILTGVPVLAVTATITSIMQQSVCQSLNIPIMDFTHISRVPNR